MAYRVQIPVELWSTLKALPPVLVDKLHRRLDGIAQLAEVAPPLNPLWLKLGATDRPLLRCMVDGYVLLYEVDETCRTVLVLDVEQEEHDAPFYFEEAMGANDPH
ncbi:type II toxin-antitoxin system RelE family toxin [Melittangium boletus]|uniref:type II toxin-antitoxin system RelE family toxin n=1 Tax=Melittangium boletus TaxID=83453 RepID=UPI003DA3D179